MSEMQHATIESGTTGDRQWIEVASGSCAVTVTVYYGEQPPRVLVDERCPGHESADELGPDGWFGLGFGGDGAVPTEAREVLDRLRRAALEAASVRWRVVRRRLSAARETARRMYRESVESCEVAS